MFLANTLIYLASFAVIWLGAGLAVSSVDRISKKLGASSFAVSFFVLGILTTIPELAVGLSAVSEGNPEIFVGNLIGGIVVIFLLIIPLLAIFGKGIKLNSQLSDRNLLLFFGVALAPAFTVIDRKVTSLEGLLLVGLYFGLFYFIQRGKGILNNGPVNILDTRSYSFIDILKVLLGVGLVFVSGNIIVDKTLYFADTFNISAFYIGLIVLSLGTNVPELSIALRSVVSRKKDIAFGNYIGSAAANTLLFGFLTVLNSGEVITVSNFAQTFMVIALGLGLFYHFTRSKHDISRKEGFTLLALYFIFLLVELWV